MSPNLICGGPKCPQLYHMFDTKILDKMCFIHWYNIEYIGITWQLPVGPILPVIYIDCFSHAGLLSANKHFQNKHFSGMSPPNKQSLKSTNI